MSASPHSPNLNDMDLNHTHIRQEMRKSAEYRHTKKVILHLAAMGLLLGGLAYSVAHSNLLGKIEALYLQPTSGTQHK